MAAIFIPLLLSPAAYFIGKRRGVKSATWFTFGVLLLSTILIIIPILSLSSENQVYLESYKWSQFGNFGLKLDGFSSPFAITIYILCTVLVFFSRSYMTKKIAGQFDNLRPKNNLTKYLEDNNSIHNTNKHDDKDNKTFHEDDHAVGSQSGQKQISQYRYDLEPSPTQ